MPTLTLEGHLDAHVTVMIDSADPTPLTIMVGTKADGTTAEVQFWPEDALALLAWLTERREHLVAALSKLNTKGA